MNLIKHSTTHKDGEYTMFCEFEGGGGFIAFGESETKLKANAKLAFEGIALASCMTISIVTYDEMKKNIKRSLQKYQ